MLFLSLSVRIFAEEISVWISWLSEEDSPLLLHPFSALGVWMGKKVEHGHFAISSSAGTSVFSYFRISELLVLWPSDSGGYTHRPSSISFAPSPFFSSHWTWIISLGFLVLQCADSTSRHISVSTITWANSHKTPLIDTHVSYWVYFSGELKYNSFLQCPNPGDRNAGFVTKNMQTSCPPNWLSRWS